MKRAVATVALCTGLGFFTGCTSSPNASTGRTEREADSVIGQSKLPGAQGAPKAIEAQDTARARAAALDTVVGQ